MKPRYPQTAPPQRDRWLVSYVDVLTILLIFFLIAAAKNLEIKQAAQPAPVPAESAVKAPPALPAAAAPSSTAIMPASTTAPAAPGRTNLIRAQERLRERGLEPTLEPRGLVITLPQVILFASGVDTVSPKALPTLARIAEVLRDIPNSVRLIGHADTIPIHNRRFASNWDLSMARCHKILELLSGRYGIAESRLSITSYGPYRPIAPNDTVGGRASNRRVEVLILDESPSEGAQIE